MGKLVLRKTILRNMIDRVWAALHFKSQLQLHVPPALTLEISAFSPRVYFYVPYDSHSKQRIFPYTESTARHL
jgi:hypothetical protein